MIRTLVMALAMLLANPLAVAGDSSVWHVQLDSRSLGPVRCRYCRPSRGSVMFPPA